MNERTLRHELERALDRYRAGAPLQACLAGAPAEIHPYVRAFDQVARAFSAPARDEFRAQLRMRFVRGAMGELDLPPRPFGLRARVATAVGAAFVMGAVVNPALANELVHQVGTTFGQAASEIVGSVLQVEVNAATEEERGTPASSPATRGQPAEAATGAAAEVPAVPEAATGIAPAPAPPAVARTNNGGDDAPAAALPPSLTQPAPAIPAAEIPAPPGAGDPAPGQQSPAVADTALPEAAAAAPGAPPLDTAPEAPGTVSAAAVPDEPGPPGDPGSAEDGGPPADPGAQGQGNAYGHANEPGAQGQGNAYGNHHEPGPPAQANA
jgi:hypothetical protein